MRGVEIGFVSYSWVVGRCCRGGIGFVSYFWVVGGQIGFVSFVWVAGGSPAERPGLNTGGRPFARVLCDGGWLGMACNSPCFRCCFILNYATHYTIKFGRCPILNGINHGFR